MVAIIPSLDLVIVRGLKEEPEFDFNGMLKGIVGVLENQINKFFCVLTNYFFANCNE
jgi:hypothetical protein